MSSFLQRLKGGAYTIDNNSPPDASGVIVRRLEKQYLSQPFETLGLSLSADAEVKRVLPNTPAMAANIPENFIIFEVNNEFVETDHQFEEAATKNVNLVVKLQAVSGLSELVARVLQDEEQQSSTGAESALNFDELLRTTPRFNFLSSDHPLFRRYMKRLNQGRQMASLIAQRTQEAEERRQKEIKEQIRKALEEEVAAAKRKEEEEAFLRRQEEAENGTDESNQEPFIQIVQDESTFGQPEKERETSPAKKTDEAAALPDEPAPVEESPNDMESEVIHPISTSELLELVGLPTGGLPPPPINFISNDVIDLEPPALESKGVYLPLPAEEYTLTNGEKVVGIIKKRRGALPLPPFGKPPKINREALKSNVAIREKNTGESTTEKAPHRLSSCTKRERSVTPELHLQRRKHSSRDEHRGHRKDLSSSRHRRR